MFTLRKKKDREFLENSEYSESAGNLEHSESAKQASENVEPDSENSENSESSELAEKNSESSENSELAEKNSELAEKSSELAEKSSQPDFRAAGGAFAAVRGLSESDAHALDSLLEEIEAAFASGEIPDQLLETLMLAVSYGRDMEKASAEALVRGRNEAIGERLKLLDESDGIPHPGCQAPASSTSFSSIFDIARDAR